MISRTQRHAGGASKTGASEQSKSEAQFFAGRVPSRTQHSAKPRATQRGAGAAPEIDVRAAIMAGWAIMVGAGFAVGA